MRKNTLLTFLLFFTLVSGNRVCLAQAKRTIHVATAGTLPSLISEDEKYQIEELTLTGELNGTDFRLIRDMGGNNYLGKKTNGRLRYLDLTDAKVVSGGLSYLETGWISYENGGTSVNENEIHVDSNEIPYMAFAGCSLNTVFLPQSVVTICKSAFWNCQLKEIVIPNSVVSIKERSFGGCNDLKSIYIPSSVTSIEFPIIEGNDGMEIISVDKNNSIYDSRENCNAIIETQSNTLVSGCKNTIIPNSVTCIGKCAFMECKSLTSIIIPNNITNIENSAFSWSGLTSVIIPSSITSIKPQTFYYCEYLTSVTIPNSVTSIGDSAFEGCSELSSITIPESVTFIYNGAFNYTRSMKSIRVESGNNAYDSRDNCNAIIESHTNKLVQGCINTIIPNSVYYIGDGAFVGSGLTTINIPNGVKSIGKDVFWSCDNLTSVTIPNSVKSIGNYAFRYCSGLTSIVSGINSPFEIPENVFDSNYDVYASATLTVPAGTKSAYQTTAGWNKFCNIVEYSAEQQNGEWRLINNDFDKSVAFTKIRVKNAKVSSGVYCCVYFSTKPNDNTTADTKYNINFNRLTIGDGVEQDDSKGYIYINSCKYIGDNWYEYDFKQPIYFSHYQTNAPKDQLMAYFVGSSQSDEVIITANNYFREYGESNPTFNYTTSGTVLNGIPTVTCEATKTSPVGTYPIKIANGSISNSNVTYVDGTLTITKAPLTITANSYSRVEGQQNPTLEVTYSGFKNGETEAVLAKKPTISTSATSASSPGSYPIQVSGAEAQNYNISYVNGTLTVTEKTDFNFTMNGINYYGVKNSNTVEVKGLSQNLNNVMIPEYVSYNGTSYKVTSIGRFAFYQNTSIYSVTIPSSVTSIGSSAFEDCTKLSFVSLSDGLTSIGGSAFENCTSLSSITLPSTVTSIALNAFKNCRFLCIVVSEIRAPFAISENVFEGIHSYPTLTVPSGTKSFYQSTAGWSKFQNIVEVGGVGYRFESGGIYYMIGDNMTVSVSKENPNSAGGYMGGIVIPNQVNYNGITYSVTSIGSYVFDGCKLFSVTIPNSIKSIGMGAFDECWDLTSVNISDLEAWCNITFGSNPLYYAHHLFLNGTEITELTIPKSISRIKSSTFQGCTNLTSVTIPENVTSIGDNAFKDCYNLKSVILEIKNPFAIDETIFSSSDSNKDIYSSAKLIVPYSTKSLYQSTAGWNKFQTIVETESSDFEFTKNDINYTVTSSNTVEVKSVNNSLKNVTIPKSVSYNGQTYQVTALGERSFDGRDDITYLSIPGSVTSIGKYAFIDCGSNINVNIENLAAWCGVTFGNKYSSPLSCAKAFYLNGLEVKNLSIPNSVESISGFAFFQCKSITSLSIPSSVKTIGSSAFEDCTGLSSISLSNGLTLINGSTFEGCKGLSSITIPSTVSIIAINAFKNCTNLNTIISEIQNPFAIDENVFSTYSTATLNVPQGTKSLYQNTSGWKNFKNIVEESPDEVNFIINGVIYQGTKSEKSVKVNSVDKSLVNLEIPSSITYDGTDYQVTGIDNDAFKGCNLTALVWDVEAALPSNAFNNASIGSNFLLYVKSSSYAPSSVKNVVVNGTASSIQLSDDGGQFYCPQAFKANSISYTHNYSMETGGNGKGWETIALPYDVQKIMHSTRGEIVPFAAYSSNSDKKPFWLAYFSSSGFRRTSQLQAYEPYIIAMPNNSKYKNDYNLAGDVTFSAENVQVAKTPTFSGLFLPAFGIVSQSSSVYALNVNNRYVRYSGSYDPGSRFISNLRDVRPFEAYINDSSTRGAFEISFDDGMTDMDVIILSANEIREVTIYTLSGQQITRIIQRDFDHVWNRLPKGVYIVNGKKRIK